MSAPRPATARLGVVLMAALLLFGILRLYDLRLSKGDTYPFHSSLRTDPMGTALLHDAIHRAGAAKVMRNYQALDEFESAATNDVMLLVGTDMSMWPKIDWTPRQTARQLSSFMNHGGHLFIALAPSYKQPESLEDDAYDELEASDANDSGTNEVAKSSADEPDLSRAEKRELSRQERKQEHYARMSSNNWDTAKWLGVAATHERRTPGVAFATQPPGSDLLLPDTLPCRTDVVLHDLAPDWTVVYEREGFPVLATRPYGNGRATISTLSYFLSNQALRDDRRTPALTWIIGNAPHVVFDETHLGLQSSQLTAELLRQHRLHWVLVVLACGGLLFVWGASTSLLPKHGYQATNAPVLDATHDSNGALTALLRRHIPLRKLLPTLVEQWADRGDGDTPACAPTLATAQEVADEQGRAKVYAVKNLLPIYNELTRRAVQARRGGPVHDYVTNTPDLTETTENSDTPLTTDTHERRET